MTHSSTLATVATNEFGLELSSFTPLMRENRVVYAGFVLTQLAGPPTQSGGTTAQSPAMPSGRTIRGVIPLTVEEE